jgi:hypothetical protein
VWTVLDAVAELDLSALHAGRQAPLVGLDLCNSLREHDEGDRQRGAEHNQRYENVRRSWPATSE